MIIFVAPYSPVGSCSHPHLGASRKIETIVRILGRLDCDLIFVNSAHNENGMCESSDRFCEIAGVKVRELMPRRWPSRKLGKLLNLFEVPFLVRRAFKLNEPSLLWLYNGYAFESLFACALKCRADCPVILEFEDWHFARGRAVNPKPWIDYLAWRAALSFITHGFCVNDTLARHLSQNGIDTTLLPGVVPEKLVIQTTKLKPFPAGREFVTVGYFGGLSVEKGAELLLEVIEKVDGPYRWVITGSGPLAPQFLNLAKILPNKVDFRGAVGEGELYEAIACCDVIVNPHSPISNMAGGVFPFKVVEAIASGRLVVSTSLPPLNIPNLLDCVGFFDGTSISLAACIKASRDQYSLKEEVIRRSRQIAIDQFGESALLGKLKKFV